MRWGIEVEAEFNDVIDYNSSIFHKWEFGHDNSLRNMHSYEFKFGKPKTTKEALELIDVMEETLTNTPEFQESIRAGVHINFSDPISPIWKWYLRKMLPIYYILEPLIVDYCDPRRSGNLFCMKLENCFHVADEKFDYLKKYKYLALRHNKELGCLEFRALTTERNFDKVRNMLRFFEQLDKYVHSDKVKPFKSLLTELSIRQGTNLEKLQDLTGIDLDFLQGDGRNQCRRIVRNMRLIQPLFIKE